MIAAVSWVPKGVAKSVPSVADPPSKEEIEELIKASDLERSGEDSGSEEDDQEMDVDAAKQTGEVSQALAVANALGRSSKVNKSETKFDDIADGLQELDMDNYDEEDDENKRVIGRHAGLVWEHLIHIGCATKDASGHAGIELFSTGLGDLYYPSNSMDPYIKDEDDDDSEDLEDMAIKPKDAVIVWILDETSDGDSNIYVHHEVPLSAFPLCTAWLDCPLKGGEKGMIAYTLCSELVFLADSSFSSIFPFLGSPPFFETSGNFIAVGSMEPAIEIWDLDIIDEVQPAVVLGGIEEKKKKKKGKKVSIKYKEGSHTDSVLGLAWNKHFRNILASASADKQVKIWDVVAGKCDITMEHHTDKVQAVAWNHHEPQVLLSGSFDRSVVMKDGRLPSDPGFKWSVTADVESLAWDPHDKHLFVVSLEDGTVQGFDIRAAKSGSASDLKPSFTLHAHDKAVCTISYNPLAHNLLATGSTDKMVKLWDLSNNQPSCLVSKNPKAGAIFSVSFSEDNPFLLAIGGSKGTLELWDTLSEAEVARRFGTTAS
ncbi:periodic tryptophan protein 1 [Populus alba x Populus x berolinensis]|nr:periodic tryptophan protein 1 [Populus alba x Populus x berolinensis]